MPALGHGAGMRIRLRQLRHGGSTFRWRAEIRCAPGSGDCHRCIRVRVWRDGKTGQALQADLLSLAWPAPLGACATDGSYPAAEDVRAVIDHGLRLGWQPAAVGGTFVLSDEDFRVGGFVLASAADPTARVAALSTHAASRTARR